MKFFNEENLNIIKNDINKALSEISDKRNIILQIGSVKFSDNKFQIEIEGFIIENLNFEFDLRYIESFNRLKKYGYLFNVSEKDFGKTFVSNGEVYRFVGLTLNPVMSRYPILGEDKKGRIFNFSEDVIKFLS